MRARGHGAFGTHPLDSFLKMTKLMNPPPPPTMQDRDENAALNMRLLLVLQLLGRDRPAVFCRPEGGVD